MMNMAQMGQAANALRLHEEQQAEQDRLERKRKRKESLEAMQNHRTADPYSVVNPQNIRTAANLYKTYGGSTAANTAAMGGEGIAANSHWSNYYPAFDSAAATTGGTTAAGTGAAGTGSAAAGGGGSAATGTALGSNPVGWIAAMILAQNVAHNKGISSWQDSAKGQGGAETGDHFLDQWGIDNKYAKDLAGYGGIGSGGGMLNPANRTKKLLSIFGL